jgi:hypothetical protein
MCRTRRSTSWRVRGYRASYAEQQRYDHLIQHVDDESEILEDYWRLGKDAKSPAFAYLARLILDEPVANDAGHEDGGDGRRGRNSNLSETGDERRFKCAEAAGCWCCRGESGPGEKPGDGGEHRQVHADRFEACDENECLTGRHPERAAEQHQCSSRLVEQAA